jgi:peroxiredoxin
VETPVIHIASTVLKPGVPVPNWRGRLLDGTAFATDDLRGRPAAVLVDWCMCLAQNPAPVFLDAARRRRDVALVLVSVESEGTTRGFVDSVGATTPVLLDEGDGLLTAWGLQGFPALVLLHADGTVADIQPATFDAGALASTLDALAGGRAIPTARVLHPFPTDAIGHQLLSSVLVVGEVAPELAARGVDGRDHSTRDLLGAKAVVGFWLPPHADGTLQGDTPPPGALLRAARDAGVRVLLIAEGEPEPGDAKRYLDRFGSVPAIVEWDGRLETTWGTVGPEFVALLDEGGRVAGVYGPQGYNQPDAILGSFVAGQPLPSPSQFP